MREEVLVTSCDKDTSFAGFSADHIHARCLFYAEWHTTDGGLRVFLNLCLGFGCAVPMAKEEAAVLDTLLELFVVVAFVDARVAVCLSFLEDVLLNVCKELLYVCCDAFQGTCFLL